MMRTRSLIREIVTLSIVVLALVFVAAVAADFIPLVAEFLYVIVAAAFIYIPHWWMERRGLDFETFGLTTDRMWRGVGWGLALTLLTLVPFAGGYYFWQTQVLDRDFAYSSANYLQWEPGLEGAPDGWGEDPGVWVWTRDQAVHIGLRNGARGDARLQLSADRPFEVRATGPVRLPDGQSLKDAGARDEWTLLLTDAHARAQLTLRSSLDGIEDFPTDLTVTTPDALPLYRGPGGEPVEANALDLDRSVEWLLLWILTQFVFIALPEEFFYRGYLQTRLRQWLERRRSENGEASSETSSFLGFTAENGITSVVFALGHLLIPIGGTLVVTRLSVFFPSLMFGWLRDRTDTIAAPVVYHACCNLMVLAAAPHFG